MMVGSRSEDVLAANRNGMSAPYLLFEFEQSTRCGELPPTQRFLHLQRAVLYVFSHSSVDAARVSEFKVSESFDISRPVLPGLRTPYFVRVAEFSKVDSGT